MSLLTEPTVGGSSGTWGATLNADLLLIDGALLNPTTIKTGSYQALVGDFVLYDATSGALNITAPAGAPVGSRWGMRAATASSNAVNAVGSGADTFDTTGTGTLPFTTGFAFLDVTWVKGPNNQWVGTSSGKPNGYLASILTPAPKRTGTATLTAGTVVVADALTTSSSVVRVANKTIGGTPGAPYISARSAGVSFTITSTNAADTSIIQFDVITY